MWTVLGKLLTINNSYITAAMILRLTTWIIGILDKKMFLPKRFLTKGRPETEITPVPTFKCNFQKRLKNKTRQI